MKKSIAIGCMALILSACGGSDGGSHIEGGGTTPPPTPPMSMVDAFFAAVSSFLPQISETAEPQPTESATATAPENTEPEPVS